jgi:hypothetical protein
LPQLIDQEERVREGGQAPDVLDLEVMLDAVGVAGGDGHVADTHGLVHQTIGGGDLVVAGALVHEVVATRLH